MPLHIDLRPKSLDKFAGNKNTIDSIKSIVPREDRPHTYLFHGPAGCGKTTLARIVARELGCTESEIQEINMSNNRGIDTARSIIDSMYFAPLSGGIKVYLMDEVHKTTADFQNAILKALEEPPSHVYFILCTTEPEKLIKTVRSRCTSFEVTRLPYDKMYLFIKKVCHSLAFKLNEEIMKQVAQESDGTPRDALIAIDKIRGFFNEGQEVPDITDLISSIQIEEKKVIDLCRALIKGETWKAVASIISELETDDWEKVRRAVLGYCTSVLLKDVNSQAAIIIDCFKESFFNSGKAGLVAACYEVIIG